MHATLESPVVVAEKVGVSFRDRSHSIRALANIDLTINAGELVSVIGPSGCGKSTLLRVLGGLLPPTQGTLRVWGDAPEKGREAKRFGLVPQTPALLPWRTVRENLTLLPRLNRGAGRGPVGDEEIDRLIGAVGLAPFADTLPGKLSGGMQQRVSLARAFALEPPVLLMDEPFAALDEITRSEMRFLLLKLWRETSATVVFVTHSIEEAVLLSDRVIVMTSSPGRVACEIAVDLARPRQQGLEDGDAFHHHTVELRHALQRSTTAFSGMDPSP